MHKSIVNSDEKSLTWKAVVHSWHKGKMNNGKDFELLLDFIDEDDCHKFAKRSKT